MTSLILIPIILVLCYALFQCMLSDTPPVLTLAVIAIIAYLGYLVYLDFDNLLALWTGIQNLPDAAAAYAAASWNELIDGMTAWGWIGFGLSVVIGIALGLGLAWPSGRALAAVEVGRLERQLQRARQEADRERDKAKQAEQAAAQDREAARRSDSLRESAERRAQGLQGQLDKAVGMADSRGKRLRDIREKKRAEKGGPSMQDQPDKAAGLTDDRDKKPRGTRGNKRTGKGRLPRQ